ncbi:DUF5979 domain-containing protein [Candidatus Saccharibacteria bacterium]|nr:DUF5979 domain-containing protein [Candidatus Saccharibacteria bacterium]MCL1963134.1 DUF5979 domain-containing protein [Candidatus Saccharibacteria bacterium]
MFRKKARLFALTVATLIIGVAVLAGLNSKPADAADPQGPYTATLRYYDDVQITYTLNYPSGGVWSGSADIPVGGMGTFSQVYCVDPFVAFHSRADSSGWDATARATTDVKTGYAAATPWTVSTAMRGSSDAVRWLVLNGYRGDYLANDTVSRVSVARLNSLYPGIGTIDKTIALMATKVAIWKTLVGDNVTILKTSLDSTPAKKSTFNALVQRLYDDAQSGRDTGLKSTSLEVLIDDSTKTINSPDNGYEFFGPLTVSATLANPSTLSASPDIDRVYLTTTGPDLAGATFVTGASDAAAALPTDAIYGTSSTGQYTSSGAVSGGVWRSDPFYVKIPAGRNSPQEFNDLLTIKAMAKAVNVPLMTGTPVTFVDESFGVQDWNSVQAFIGASSDGLLLDLYAEDTLQTGQTTLGRLNISKQVEGATPLDRDQEFRFRVHYAATNNYAISVLLDLNAHPVYGAFNTIDSHTFTLKNGGSALFENLPTDAYYWVEEISVPIEYDAGYLIPTAAMPVTIRQMGNITSSFMMDDDLAVVKFVNARHDQKGHLYVGKMALRYPSDNSPPDYEMVQAFEFQLEGSADGGATWSPVNLAGVFDSGDGVIVNAAQGRFSLKTYNLAFIEIDPDLIYRVTETDAAGFTPLYSYYHFQSDGDSGWTSAYGSNYDNPDWGDSNYATNNLEFAPNDCVFLSFVNLNTSFHNLSISKTVSGDVSPSDLNQLYQFQVFYLTDNKPFFASGPIPLATAFTGNEMLIRGITVDRITNDSGGNPTIINLKHGETATIIGLPAGNYRIVELANHGHRATYSINVGDAKPASGGATEDFYLDGDTIVAFKNTVASRLTTPNSGSGGDIAVTSSVIGGLTAIISVVIFLTFRIHSRTK